MRYVIIGNGPAGINAAEAIRKVDKKNQIIIFSDEPYPAYSRVLLPYFIGQKVSKEKLFIRGQEFYEKNDIALYLGTKVLKVNSIQNELFLSNTRRLNYDKLLIATGGLPKIPFIEGIDGNEVVTLRKLEDGEKILSLAQKKKRVVFIGGGLISLKLAEALHSLGLDISIIVSSNWILSRMLDETGAQIVQKHLFSQGLRILTNQNVQRILTEANLESKERKISGIIIEGGKRISCDFVFIGKGVLPNTDLVQGDEIKIEGGIPVDEYMRTNVNNVFAAGDVAETFDKVSKKSIVSAIWPMACEQGKIAGYNMAGIRKSYRGSIRMNAVELFGLPIVSIGLSGGKRYKELINIVPEEKKYRKIVVEKDRVKGAIFIGNIRASGIIAGLINSQKKLIDVDRLNFLSDHLCYGDLIRRGV